MLAQLRNPTDATSRLLLSCWVGILGGTALIPPRAISRMACCLSDLRACRTLPSAICHLGQG